MKVTIDKNFSVGKYHWNHRVVRHTHNGETWLAIHEAHYQNPGVGHGPCDLTVDPVIVSSDSVEGLRWVLERMLLCLDKPILDYETQQEERPA